MIFENADLHHIGIVVVNYDEFLQQSGLIATYDQNQNLRVAFNNDGATKIEYLERTGRLKNSPIGFNHLCYQFSSEQEFKLAIRDMEYKFAPVTSWEGTTIREFSVVKFFLFDSRLMLEVGLNG